MRITLPKAAQWSETDNYAENLRAAIIAGECATVPTGNPATRLTDAGWRTLVLSDGRILTVADDFVTVALDGCPAGRLASEFRTAMADGDRVIVFTANGREWIDGGTLQAPEPGTPQVEITTAEGRPLSAEVIPPAPLKGVYSRMTGALQNVDCQAMGAQIGAALSAITSQAAALGMLVNPSWVGWQMVDVDGRIVARGEPERFGTLQGNSTLRFTASKTGSTFVPVGSDMLSANAFALAVKVERSANDFWRRRIKSLEIIVWPNCAEVSGSTGHFTEINSESSALTVAATLKETERSGSGIIAARIDMPLEGSMCTLKLSELDSHARDEASLGNVAPTPTEVCCSGSLTAYVLEPDCGVIGIADVADPLRLTARARICRGDILRICSPVGSAGGWNYGRHHLLAFATDGVYAVSVDGPLLKISSTRVCAEGIARADAVTASPHAVYAVTSNGSLLAFTGSKVRSVASPVASPIAVTWCGRYGELIVLGSGGVMAAIDREQRASLRTLFRAERLVDPGMAVDSTGALRDLADEADAPVVVKWQRREPMRAGALRRRVTWVIDTAAAAGLTLTLLADGGGSPQRIIELNVDGAVNSPLEAVCSCPRRRYVTAALRGTLTPPARLLALML